MSVVLYSVSKVTFNGLEVIVSVFCEFKPLGGALEKS